MRRVDVLPESAAAVQRVSQQQQQQQQRMSQQRVSQQRVSQQRVSQQGDLVFQVVSWFASDEQVDGGGGGGGSRSQGQRRPYSRQYCIKAFGVTEEGASVAATITGFTPYFYVRVPEQADERALCAWLRKREGRGWKVRSVEVVDRKDFWGFANGATSRFCRVVMTSQFGMRAMARELQRGGGMRMYESNLDPLLRFVHVQDLQPAGWVRLVPGPSSCDGRRSSPRRPRATRRTTN